MIDRIKQLEAENARLTAALKAFQDDAIVMKAHIRHLRLKVELEKAKEDYDRLQEQSAESELNGFKTLATELNKELVTARQEVQDLKATYKNLWDSHVKTSKKLAEVETRLKEIGDLALDVKKDREQGKDINIDLDWLIKKAVEVK